MTRERLPYRPLSAGWVALDREDVADGAVLHFLAELDVHDTADAVFEQIVRDPHFLTFGRRDFPLYCTHCASGNREQFQGKPLIFVVDGHAQMKRGMPCRQYQWKTGAQPRVKPRLLQQVGMSASTTP